MSKMKELASFYKVELILLGEVVYVFALAYLLFRVMGG